MNKGFDFKKWAPYLVALVVFIMIPLIFSSPVLEGKKLRQGDITNYKGMSKEIHDFRSQYGEEPLWTGSPFSGMPTFTISTLYRTNISSTIQRVVVSIFPQPVNFLFLLLVGFFILLRSFKVDPWISIAGALAFAFSSNFLTSIEAGHNTKVLSIAFMPAIIGGIVLCYNKKYIAGGIITTIFLALQIISGHFQIIYYTILVALVIGIVYLIISIKEKQFMDFAKSSALLLLAALLAVLPNFSKLYNTSSHTGESMRGGGSELSKNQESEGGLDINYALNDWSYGIMESFTLMVPDFEGGSSSEKVGKNSASYKALSKYLRLKESANAPLYKGPQRFTSPIYFGASVFFLFLFGIFLVKGKNRYWIYAITALSLMIAWGSHFTLLNGFLFNNFPLFNKFRNPAMALCIAGMAVPLLGFLALNKLTGIKIKLQEGMAILKKTGIAAGALFAIVLLIGLTSDFKAADDDAKTMESINNMAGMIFSEVANEPQYAGQIETFKTDFHEAVLKDRKSAYFKSTGRSFIFMALVAGLLFFFIKGKLKKGYLIGGIAIVCLLDVVLISGRYLNKDNYVEKRNENASFNPTPADLEILKDKSPSYRVLNYSGSMYSDGLTPYHHKSILGYSAAKIQLYQDLILNELGNQLNKIPTVFNSTRGNVDLINTAFKEQLPVINMLNTKYIMLGTQANSIFLNENACGNAWFIEEIRFVPDADNEMASLSAFDPSRTAIIQEKFRQGVSAESFAKTPDAMITLTDYKSNHLTYKSQNQAQGFAVFSEVYYKNGWKAYIDKQEVPITKVNYALRGMNVPVGEHDIEMVFEPSSWKKGERISAFGSILFILFILLSAGFPYLKNRFGKKAGEPKEHA